MRARSFTCWELYRTDTMPDVIHDAAQRPSGRRRSSIVDNSAARGTPVVEKLSPAGGRARPATMLGTPAKDRSTAHVTPRPRSVPHEPARLAPRSPDRGETPVQRSKRTSPHGRGSPPREASTPPPRGPRIRSTGNGLLTRGGVGPTHTPAGAPALSQTDPSETDPSETDPSETDPSETDPSETDPSETDPSRTDPTPAPTAADPGAGSSDAPFARLTHFGGFDWAGAEHQVVVVDPQGTIVLSLRFADDAQGWAQFRQQIAPFARPGVGLGPPLGVAIETNCGPAVERLLGPGPGGLPDEPQVRRALPRPQGARRGQGRRAGRVELRRRPAHRRPRLAAAAGGRCWRRTRSRPSCACSAATRSGSSSSAPPWSTSSAPPCTSITRRRWTPSTTGSARPPGGS